jgi:hypothetical protein
LAATEKFGLAASGRTDAFRLALVGHLPELGFWQAGCVVGSLDRLGRHGSSNPSRQPHHQPPPGFDHRLRHTGEAEEERTRHDHERGAGLAPDRPRTHHDEASDDQTECCDADGARSNPPLRGAGSCSSPRLAVAGQWHRPMSLVLQVHVQGGLVGEFQNPR